MHAAPKEVAGSYATGVVSLCQTAIAGSDAQIAGLYRSRHTTPPNRYNARCGMEDRQSGKGRLTVTEQT